MRKQKNKLLKIAYVIIVACISVNLSAQDVTISGKVADSATNGDPYGTQYQAAALPSFANLDLTWEKVKQQVLVLMHSCLAIK